MPKRGWVKTVSSEWIGVVAKHRPDIINIWETGYNSWVRVQPGDLVILKRRGSVEDIVGFGTVYSRFPGFVSTVWGRYGFGNGVADEGDLQAQAARRRSGRSVADPVIGNIIIRDLIHFADRPFKLFQQSAVRPGHHPWRFIPADNCGALADQLIKHAGNVHLDEAHAAMGDKARNDARYNAWEDGVRTAYRWCCAITKIRAREILRVVAIQPLECGGQLHISNGVLLALNLATLVEEKLITFHLNGALLVSPDLALQDPELCRDVGCRILKLPKRLDEQPAQEQLSWRLETHFKR